MDIMSATLHAPLHIKKLEEHVINRIAAGEIVQRPSSAIKELVENSLDAGSTSISVTIKDGGLDYMLIQDNGCGIRKNDLIMVCERFTTSKLTDFADLLSISTFGFRGEALASISHVAHVSIVTKTRQSSCAYKAKYKDGKLLSEIRPCAAVAGTAVTIEDLFYNMQVRRQALQRAASDEYMRILDVIVRYSVHFGDRGIAFTCKKLNGAAPDLLTAHTGGTVANIRAAYGVTVSKELLHLQHEAILDSSSQSSLHINGYISGPNYSSKKPVMIFFINDRLVDCASIRKVIDSVFADFLPKHTHPFVYLSLRLSPHSVDVNVHPTKREVHFLHEDRVLEAVHAAIVSCQLSNTSRQFSIQLPTVQTDRMRLGCEESSNAEQQPVAAIRETAQRSKSLVPASAAVRTDPTLTKISAYFSRCNEDTVASPPSLDRSDMSAVGAFAMQVRACTCCATNEDTSTETAYNTAVAGTYGELKVKAPEDGFLSSSRELNGEVLRKHTFVGVVDAVFSIVQGGTGMYLVDHLQLAEGVFYHAAVSGSGKLNVVQLDPPASISLSLQAALEHSTPDLLEPDRDTLVRRLTKQLTSNRDFLQEHFQIAVSSSATLDALPVLLDGHAPMARHLPHFLLQLALTMDTALPARVSTAARVLARYYSHLPTGVSSHNETASAPMSTEAKHLLENVIFVAARNVHSMCAARVELTAMLADVVRPVASLENLYKVFERC